MIDQTPHQDLGPCRMCGNGHDAHTGNRCPPEPRGHVGLVLAIVAVAVFFTLTLGLTVKAAINMRDHPNEPAACQVHGSWSLFGGWHCA
jgi:hypothetical protein